MKLLTNAPTGAYISAPIGVYISTPISAHVINTCYNREVIFKLFSLFLLILASFTCYPIEKGYTYK